MNKFDWSHIKEGFRGFEKLAYQYVKSEFPTSFQWEKTKETRDGNKDACAIIIGYQANGMSSEQWWMEAKYSTQTQILSRYRLDATIVSAILEENVTNIIFVTNVSLSTKTMIDIRTALFNATVCREVHFATKNTLEYWLDRNQKIFKKFFYKKDRDCLKLPSFFIIEEMEFFSAVSKRLSFYESLKELCTDIPYYAYCSVFSSEERTIELHAPEGIIISSFTPLQITTGETQLVINFQFSKEYLNEFDKTGKLFFNINGFDILSKYNISLIERTDIHLNIRSQQVILNSLKDSMMKFKRNSQKQFCALKGNSGIGKSFVLMQLIKPENIATENIFFGEFTDDNIYNLKLVINLMIYLLFPFMYPKDIDSNFIDGFSKNNYISDFMKDVIMYYDSPDQLVSMIHTLGSGKCILPPHLSINRRLIILDNMQKAVAESITLLNQILLELYNQQAPVFAIMSGQPSFFESSSFQGLYSQCAISMFQYSITFADMLEIIQDKLDFELHIAEGFYETNFPSVIEILYFAKYLGELDHAVTNMKEFLVACKIFLSGDYKEEYILKLFHTAFEQHPLAQPLCNRIYWSMNGISANHLNEQEKECIPVLRRNNLVKYNLDLQIVPYHDLYQDYYRKHYRRTGNVGTIINDDYYGTLYDSLLFSYDRNTIDKAVAEIEDLSNAGKFYSVLYILEQIFEQENLDDFKSRLGAAAYYRLYLLYALGVTNESRKRSGREVFLVIVKETEGSSNPDVIRTCTKALWEIINSNFEWMDYPTAVSNIKKLTVLLERLQMLGQIKDYSQDCLYIYSQSILLFMLSEQERLCAEANHKKLMKMMSDEQYQYAVQVFEIRYAQTLYMRDIETADELLKKAQEKIPALMNENDKFFLWSKFDYIYLQLARNHDTCTVTSLLQTHEKLKKDCYNDYRKKCLALALYFYSKGNLHEGNTYLFNEAVKKRELRPRQKAIFYIALALYEILSDSQNEAVNLLMDAEELFSVLPGYAKIITHNISVLKKQKLQIDHINFCFDKSLDPDTFYLDPRYIW